MERRAPAGIPCRSLMLDPPQRMLLRHSRVRRHRTQQRLLLDHRSVQHPATTTSRAIGRTSRVSWSDNVRFVNSRPPLLPGSRNHLLPRSCHTGPGEGRGEPFGENLIPLSIRFASAWCNFRSSPNAVCVVFTSCVRWTRRAFALARASSKTDLIRCATSNWSRLTPSDPPSVRGLRWARCGTSAARDGSVIPAAREVASRRNVRYQSRKRSLFALSPSRFALSKRRDLGCCP